MKSLHNKAISLYVTKEVHPFELPPPLEEKGGITYCFTK